MSELQVKDIINQVKDLADNAAKMYDRLFNAIDSKNFQEILQEMGYKTCELPNELAKGKYCAIDGSSLKYNVGDSYMIIARAVLIRGEVPEKSIEIPNEPLTSIKILGDYRGETNVGNDAIRLMLTMETGMIAQTASEQKYNYVFIDGPIVDPPTIGAPSEQQNTLYKDDCFMFNRNIDMIPDLKELAACRAKSIITLLEQGAVVIGIAKRFSERFLGSAIKNTLSNEQMSKNEDIATARERVIVGHLLKDGGAIGWLDWNNWLPQSDLYSSQGEEAQKSQAAQELSSLMSAYNYYKEYSNHRWAKDFNISSLYVRLSPTSHPVRIDVPYIGASKPEISKVLAPIITWKNPFAAEATMLTWIADKMAKISNQEAKSYASFYMKTLLNSVSRATYSKLLQEQLSQAKPI